MKTPYRYFICNLYSPLRYHLLVNLAAGQTPKNFTPSLTIFWFLNPLANMSIRQNVRIQTRKPKAAANLRNHSCLESECTLICFKTSSYWYLNESKADSHGFWTGGKVSQQPHYRGQHLQVCQHYSWPSYIRIKYWGQIRNCTYPSL